MGLRLARLLGRAPVLCLALGLGLVAVPAAGQSEKAILVLHTFGYDARGRAPFDSAFARAIQESLDDRVELFVETLDPNRFGGEWQERRMRQYLRDKYAGKDIATLVAVYDRALAFLLDSRDPLFAGVPIAALVTRQTQSPPDHVAVIWAADVLTSSVRLALKLRPNARQIAVIDGVRPTGGRDLLHGETQRQIAALGTSLPVVTLRDLPLDELLPRVRELPPDTVIHVARQFIGPRGQPIANLDPIAEMSRVARAPVYVSTDQQIGTGATGGVAMSIEGNARQLARLAIERAQDPSLRIPPAENTLVPMFDWRQLRRWGIDERLLPPGSVVRFRQPGVWDRYKGYIIGAAVIVGLQSALIAGLVVQHARRRRTELALRQSYEQNQDLAGRLINAQEGERTRIARELHDDVSQQVAGLSIMLSGLKRRIVGLGAEADVDRTLTTLQDRATSLAEAVRSLSHELHPGTLQHTGLVAALQHHCADIERQHQVDVTFGAEGDFDGLAPDVALCLYRVTQEALSNAVRHGNAGTMDVRLVSSCAGVKLTVADDGVGFVDAERGGSGLGLRSIGERVRLAGGRVNVRSQPGVGTQVRVDIPRVAASVAGEVMNRDSEAQPPIILG